MCVCVCVNFSLVIFSHAITFLSATQLLPHEDPPGEEACEANELERYCILGDQCVVGGTGVVNQPDAEKNFFKCILCSQTFHEECHRKVTKALSRNSNSQVSGDECLVTRLWDVASRCCQFEKREMHSCCSFLLEEISKYDAGAYICLWCTVLLESTATVE